MHAKRREVDEKELQSRFRNATPLHYSTLLSVIKGVTLANAVTVLAGLFAQAKWDLMAPWFASFLLMILTYEGTITGLAFVERAPRWSDVHLPFLLGTLEFSLFSLLQRRETDVFWFWVYALASFTALLVISGVKHRLDVQLFSEGVARIVASEYERSLGRDRIAALAVGSFALISGEVGLATGEAFRSPLALVLGVLMVIALIDHERLRSRLATSLAI